MSNEPKPTQIQQENIFRLLLEEENLRQQLKDMTQVLREKLSVCKTKIRRILAEQGQYYLNFPQATPA